MVLIKISLDVTVIHDNFFFLKDIKERHVDDLTVKFFVFDTRAVQSVADWSEWTQNGPIVEHVLQEVVWIHKVESLIETEFSYLQIFRGETPITL